MSDLLGSVLTISTVLIFLVLSEGLAKLGKITKESARKLIHISVGNVIFFIPLFETRLIAAAIPFTFVFGNYLLSPMSPLPQLRLRTFKAGHAWGTILYPLSLSITTFVFFDEPWIIVAAFFPVVYGDGFAAVFGPNASRGHFKIFGNTKTLVGTSAFALFSWGSVSLGIILLGYEVALAVYVASVVAILGTLVELISFKGTDNLMIPAVLSVVVFFGKEWFILGGGSVDLGIYLVGVSAGIIFAVGGYLASVLTVDGAMAGFIITTLMLGMGGYIIGLQLLLFFVLGSGATKLVTKLAKITQDEFEKGGEQRDAIQAVANAGFPAILSLIFVVNPTLELLFIISGIMSASLIDTMSTEIGIATQGTPVRVLTPWKRAQPGDTGVISLKGTLGGLAFGLLFAGSILVLMSLIGVFSDKIKPIQFLIIVVCAGFLGMLTDSVLGVTLQRHNQCVDCGKIVEANYHHDQKTWHSTGFSWFNNDLTNILGSLSGGIFAIVLLLIWS